MTERRFKLFFTLATLVAVVGCTQLKQQPSTTLSPTPKPTASEEEELDESPAPFPSPSPTPTPSPSPTEDTSAPKVTITAPTATTDFTSSAVDVTFGVTVGTGRKVVDAKILYDGLAIATFNQNATSYQLAKWNPNLINSPAGDTTPSKFGDHTLTVTAKDDKGTEGKAEVKFYRPLKIGAWKEATSMPGPIAYTQAFSDGAFPASFMLPWGTADDELNPVVEATSAYTFNPAGDGSWTTNSLAGVNTNRAAFGWAVHPTSVGVAYLVGGRKAASDLATIELFSPLNRQANQSPIAMATARMKPAVAILDNFLYVFGGQQGTTALASVERVKLDSNGEPSGAFEARAPMPTARAGAKAVVVGTEIWVIGGGFKPMLAYDPAKNTWKEITNAAGTILGTPETWSDAQMVPVAGRYYFFGGVKEDGQPITRISELDPVAKAWRDMGDLPKVEGVADALRSETGMAVCYDNGWFYVFGGVSLPDKGVTAKVFKAPAQ